MSSLDILKREKTFSAVKPVKYIFQHYPNSDHLVVVFSAFNPKGSAPAYNYIRTIQSLDVNKLFILDDQGERGSYYLGINRTFDAEAAVVSLITKIANENNILHKNVICCGSSKGGFAALYFGIKYYFGHVIVGAPQTRLGSYLQGARELPTFELIAGDTSDSSKNFLDQILYDVVSQAERVPNIMIHVGSGDHHYKGHVLPFVDHLKSKSFDCYLDIKDYSDHGDATHYQKLLVDTIIDRVPHLKDSLRVSNVQVTLINNHFTVRTITNREASYAWYVFKNGERIKVEWYKDNPVFNYTAEPGRYYFEAFAKDDTGFLVSKKSDEFVVEENGLTRVDIFGSCVTRDVFRVVGVTDIELNYHARTSIISQMSEPVQISKDEIVLESQFQKKMVTNDLEKNFIQTLEGANILIIDFVDERFDLLKYNDSILTRSVEFVRSGLEEKLPLERIARFQETTFELWGNKADKFIKQILSIVPKDRIFLHEAYWAYEFVNAEGIIEKFENIEEIKKNNDMLKRYYDYFKKLCPGIKVVSGEPVGDAQHVWGKSPLHYTDNYYLDIYQQITRA
ncbi:accessory Sec system protein Asp2 [Paenibacillus rhizolycopersici]|uniref:accessory Sec system protein Asp2 n=1 Tax=Paenibacillus rhizolycopersici TaxID=2780073 RepID=UPI003D282870